MAAWNGEGWTVAGGGGPGEGVLPPWDALRNDAVAACLDLCSSDACVLFSPAQLALHAVTRVVPDSDLRTRFVNAVVFTALDDSAKAVFLRAMSGVLELFNELQRAAPPDDVRLAAARGVVAARGLSLAAVFDPEVVPALAARDEGKRRRVEEAAANAVRLEDDFLTAGGL